MNHSKYDIEYMSIVNSILENKDFNEMKNIEHHGITRYDHLCKISYHSYKISKALKLDYYAAARAGLLHDFFPSKPIREGKEWVFLTFNHAVKALNHSGKTFLLNDKEKDIIRSHMFPYTTHLVLPKYAESWIVNIVDKVIGTTECLIKFRLKLSYVANLYLLFLLNSIK